MIDRRRFLFGSALLGAAGLLPLRVAMAAGEKRLMVIVLRGGMDSLGVLVPYSDPRYAALRGDLALPPQALEGQRLDATFALHPALQPLLPLWQAGELALLPACATPYRERSHFDAQNVLESGAAQAHRLESGWLNRTLAALPGARAMAIGDSVPLILRGLLRSESWSPTTLPQANQDFLGRVAALYAHDPLLAGSLDHATRGAQVNGRGAEAFAALCLQAAVFLRGDARLATLDLDGWDTHVGQGAEKGRLGTQLAILAKGIVTLRATLAEQWRNTALLVVTEFGRTARHNGSGGTDHGTGSLALLAGGNLKGGRWLGDWPTLASLYQDRDLQPANDLRALCSAVLTQHLGLDGGVVAERVLPGTAGLAGYGRLFGA